jgi:hypothetical protein
MYFISLIQGVAIVLLHCEQRGDRKITVLTFVNFTTSLIYQNESRHDISEYIPSIFVAFMSIQLTYKQYFCIGLSPFRFLLFATENLRVIKFKKILEVCKCN